MSDILLSPLRRIPTSKGDVLHGMKATDAGFAGFGEAYFSIANEGVIKGWKRHRIMTLNLICVQGAICVVGYRDGDRRPAIKRTFSPDRSEDYVRITIPPMVWVGFQGMTSGVNMLLNLASHTHEPEEAETRPLDAFDWPGLW